MGRIKELYSANVDDHGVTQSGHYLSVRSKDFVRGKRAALYIVRLEDSATLADYKDKALELSVQSDNLIVIKGAHGNTIGTCVSGEYLPASRW